MNHLYSEKVRGPLKAGGGREGEERLRVGVEAVKRRAAQFRPFFSSNHEHHLSSQSMLSSSAKLLSAGLAARSVRAERSVLSRASLSKGGGGGAKSRAQPAVSPSFLPSFPLLASLPTLPAPPL